MIKFAEMDRTSPQTLERLWEEINKFPRWTLFDGLDSKEILAQRLTDINAPHWWVVENDAYVGYVSAYPDTPWSMVFHLLMFDRRIRGRIERIRDLCDWILKTYNLELLRTMLPITHRTSLAQAKTFGFQFDGIYSSMARQKGISVDFALLSYRGIHPQAQKVTVQEPEFDEQGEAMIHFLNGEVHAI